MPITTADTDFELRLADGSSWLGLSLAVPRDEMGRQIDGAPKSLEEVMLAAEERASPVMKRLDTKIKGDWSGGLGIDHNGAYAVYCRSKGYATRAGGAYAVQVPSPNSATPLVAISEFSGDLFIAQRGNVGAGGGRVVRSVGGTGGVTLAGGSTSGAFADSLEDGTAGMNVPAGVLLRDLCVFQDGDDNEVLYASASDSAGVNGRLYRWDGSAWTQSGAIFDLMPDGINRYGRNRMKKVFWRTGDGQGAWRLVCISSRNTISYTKPNSDPFLAASWVEGVRIDTGYELLELVAARNHVFVTAKDGVFDLNELGESPNLVTTLEDIPLTGNGENPTYLDGYVYYGFGQGVGRVRVEDTGVIQENAGICSPGWGTAAENDSRGYLTASCTDQGWYVGAFFNPTTAKSYVYWGKDRETLGVETPNPLVWHGPEVHTLSDYKITRMKVSGLTGDLRLWLCAQSVAGSTPIIEFVSIPLAGSPIQDIASGGSQRFLGTSTIFNVGTRLHALPDPWDDQASIKYVHETTFSTRGINEADGTMMSVYHRADASPGLLLDGWGSATEIDESPTYTTSPATEVSGHRIEMRVDWSVPQGNATPPKIAILDEIRSTVWRIVPTFQVIQLPFEVGDGVWSISGATSEQDLEDIKEALVDVTRIGRTRVRDPQNQQWEVKVGQVLSLKDVYHEDSRNRTVTGSLELSVIRKITA